jgi:hypothetical protein
VAIRHGINFEIACKIREMYKDTTISFLNIAKRFKISENLVRNIVLNKVWPQENYKYMAKENHNMLAKSGENLNLIKTWLKR